MPSRKGAEYKDGELETILSLVPTVENIKRLSKLLDRSEDAIKIVYQFAYGHSPFGKNADIQEQKIIAAKNAVGIAIGRKKARTNKLLPV
jgi:hypothetical protein